MDGKSESRMKLLHAILIPLLRSYAQRLMLRGKSQRALAVFIRINRWQPKRENLFNLGLCHFNLRHYAEAIRHLQPVYELLPTHLFAGVSYAQCLLLDRRWDEALAIYQALAEQHPDNMLLSKMTRLCQDPVVRDKYATSLDYQYQASQLQQQKQLQPALELLRIAADLTPGDAVVHNNLGALLLSLKFPVEEAIREFGKAVELDPANDRYKRNYRKAWQKKRV